MRGIKIFIFLSILIFNLNVNAQGRYNDNYNRLGIQAGITHGGINSSNFNTLPKTRYMAGLTTRASFFRNFLIICGVNFYEFKTGLTGYESKGKLDPTEIDFDVTGVQLNLLLGTKIFGEYLSFEVGPVLQINSKMTTEDPYKNYFVENYNIRAQDLENISNINLNLAANVSAGIRDVKIWIQAQYGVNNIFKGLNTKELENKDSRMENLNAHMGFATAGIVVYL